MRGGGCPWPYLTSQATLTFLNFPASEQPRYFKDGSSPPSWPYRTVIQ